MAFGVPYSRAMDCSDVHAAVREGRREDDHLRAHTAVCDPCAALLAADGAVGRALAAAERGPEPTDRILDRVEADRSLRTSIARVPTSVRRWMAALALTLPGVAAAFFAPRPDLAAYPAARMIAVLSLLGAMALVLSPVVLRPLHRDPPRRGLARVAAAFCLPVILGALPRVATGHPASIPEVDLLSAAWGCFVVGSAMAAGTFLVLVVTERRGRAPLGWIAAATALAAFSGALVLQIICPVTDPAHLVVGHGLIGAAWAAVLVLVVAAVRALLPARAARADERG